MKKDSLQIVELTETIKWDEFVYNHPQGNIFQTSQMMEVYKRTKYHKPVSLAVVNGSSDEILAIISAVIIKENALAGYFSSRSIIQGGPLYVKNENGLNAVSLLMKEYNKIAEEKALYSEIRPIYDLSEVDNILNECGYNLEEHLNFLISINKPKEDICKQIHKSMRKNIKKACKSGVTVEEINDRKQIGIFYDFLKEVYHNAKVPLADISLFEAIYDILVPKGLAKFHFAKHENKYIGGRLSLLYKDRIYAHSVGVPLKYRYLYPNALLNYYIMAYGSENRYNVFDFGGAGKPNKDYGARDFKSQFGGDMVNYGRYKNIYSPLILKFAEKSFNFYKKIYSYKQGLLL